MKKATKRSTTIRQPVELADDVVIVGAVLWRPSRRGNGGYEAFIISGETQGLWISGHHKINKKTLVERDGNGRGDHVQWLNTAQKKEAVFRDEHEWKIRESVRGCSAEQLRQIAHITGYKGGVS